jgi:hypothetical protein
MRETHSGDPRHFNKHRQQTLVKLRSTSARRTSMEHYRVFLRGENFILAVDGEVACLGFYTTRFVRAKGREAAETLAVDLIRGDSKLAEVRNPRDNPPMIYIEEIEEVVENEVQPNSGYSFFQMDEEAEALDT